MAPNRQDFERCLNIILDIARSNNLSSIIIEAKQLHKIVGEYPGPNHRMPVCCSVMRATMSESNEELPNKLKKDGASLKIRYHLSS